MSFVAYDLIFLVLFTLGVVIFLYTRKHNLQRQGILFLYRTKLGIRFIDTFAKKFEKILRPMQYVVIVSGYILMILIIWLIVKTVYIYMTTSISQVIRAPPIAPLIPYFPKLFGLEAFFPPLYFTYFIIALAIVAISHEFAHGIFARLHGFKIHATGFAFLGPFLGAFVEPDEKQMNRAGKVPQLAILAAGTFANVLMTILFGAMLWLFFSGVFVPAGVKYNSYAVDPLEVAGITVVDGEPFLDDFIEVSYNGELYFVRANSLERANENGLTNIYAYLDSPAFRNQIEGAITEIDGVKIDSYGKLSEALNTYSPGEEINLKTAVLETGRGTVATVNSYDLVLGEREDKAFLGVGFISNERKGLIGILNSLFSKIKDPLLHYESSIGDFGWFIYYLLWWIVVINILVALFNMLPLGILDGGRFFYLTVWAVTRSEKVGRKAFSFVTWALLAALLALMIKWAIGFF